MSVQPRAVGGRRRSARRRPVARWASAFAAGLALLAGPVAAGAEPVPPRPGPPDAPAPDPSQDASNAPEPAGRGGAEIGALVEQPDGTLAVVAVSVAGGEDPDVVADALEALPQVRAAEVNRRRGTWRVTNDQYYPSQWALRQLPYEAAWLVGNGSGQVVAVVDSGVHPWVPELWGALLPGADCWTTLDCVPGFAIDDFFHGTFVASLIASLTNNGVGIAGAAPGARILPVKIGDASGFDELSVASGIVFAANNGATVITLSLGFDEFVPLVADAVAYARSRGIVVVAAAGNDGPGAVPLMPSALPGVVDVGALAPDGTVAWFSSRGAWVDVVAPGADIVGADIRCGCYSVEDGTSFAAPYVAAQAAIVRSANPSLSGDQVAALISSTAVDRGAFGRDVDYGYGVVHPQAAAVEATMQAVVKGEILDGAGGAGGRTTNAVGSVSAAASYRGAPHVYYYDATGGNLRHGWWNGFGWYFETLDGAGGGGGRVNADVGRGIAAIEYAGQAHVFYRDDTNQTLRHAWWTGTAWRFEVLDGPGATTPGRDPASAGTDPAAVLYGGAPHVVYARGADSNLGHAWWTGAQWATETLDGAGGPGGRVDRTVGARPAVVVWNGQLHAFYDDTTDGDLRHGWWWGGGWWFEKLDGHTTGSGRTLSPVGDASAVLFAGGPHVFFTLNPTGPGDGDLRHGWWNGSAWWFETLDGNVADAGTGRRNGDLGEGPAAFLLGGVPHVWYFDATNGELRRTWWNGLRWQARSEDGYDTAWGRTTNVVGAQPSVLLFNGWPHVFHGDATAGDLRHAWAG